MNWLSEPWWAGVQGIASLLGVAAIVVAVVDFLLRLNLEAPDAMSFEVSRSQPVNGMVDVMVTARPMGPHVVYEPEWRVWGDSSVTPPGIVPRVLDARDAPVVMTMRVHHRRVQSVTVGLTWVVPRRFSSHAAAARRGIAPVSDYERWVVYRWRYWPRKANGYWRKNREAKKSNPLFGPE